MYIYAVYDQPDIKVLQKSESMREELPLAWEKLPTKALEVENETTPLILGKGNKTGVE